MPDFPEDLGGSRYLRPESKLPGLRLGSLGFRKIRRRLELLVQPPQASEFLHLLQSLFRQLFLNLRIELAVRVLLNRACGALFGKTLEHAVSLSFRVRV